MTSNTNRPRQMMIMTFILGLNILLLQACLTMPNVQQRVAQATQLAQQADWAGIKLHSTPHALHAFVPQNPQNPTAILSIYIEGDGAAWKRRRLTDNPTPANPVALRLATLDQGVAAYLARPCQYEVDSTSCDPALWSMARFSEAVIESSNNAIEQLKQRFAAQQLRLIGFSGGGAVAALVAARRSDVTHLVTIAGNLDHAVWTHHHRVTPLSNSLNPADSWRQLMNIPQTHFIGEDDRIVGRFVAEAYRQRFPANRQPRIQVVKDVDHSCCWAERWPSMMQTM